MQCSPVELDADPTPDLPRDLGNLPPKEAANSCSNMRHQPMSDVRGWRQETHIRLKADDSGSKVLFRRMDFSKQFQFKDLDLLARIFSSLTDNIEPRLHSGNPPTATLMRESPFSLHKAAPMIISDSKTRLWTSVGRTSLES